MPRTDENERGLQAVLGYLVDRSIPHTEIFGALGMARNTYWRRSAEDDFPHAEECLRIARHFGLNPLALMHTFGIFTTEEVETFINVIPLRAGGKATTKVRKLDTGDFVTPASTRGRRLSKLPRRPDMPKL